jgi:hypothetical protein
VPERIGCFSVIFFPGRVRPSLVFGFHSPEGLSINKSCCRDANTSVYFGVLSSMLLILKRDEALTLWSCGREWQYGTD